MLIREGERLHAGAHARVREFGDDDSGGARDGTGSSA
jgi:hypothetical protein